MTKTDEKIKEEVVRRVSQERQTELAILNAVKQELRTHTKEDDQNFGSIVERQDELDRKFKNLSDKVTDHLDTQRKNDRKQFEHNIKSENILNQILTEAKKTNGRVTKLEDKTAELPSLIKDRDSQRQMTRDNNRIWKERLAWLVSILILIFIYSFLRGQGMTDADLQRIMELTNNLP